jgi:Mg2+-importing ATPase
MAIASLFLPFLPLTPIQILLNNLLYDLSEIGIPFDGVDRDDLATPHAWDMNRILRFTVIMGAVSSIFDVATFFVLLRGFDADAQQFRTAWFVESIATQILVIFVIRTRGVAWLSAPHPVLTLTSLGALALALALALSPIGRTFGFAAMPALVLVTVAAIVAAYLAGAELAKRFAAT